MGGKARPAYGQKLGEKITPTPIRPKGVLWIPTFLSPFSGHAAMLSFQDLRFRVSNAIRRVGANGPDASLHLTGRVQSDTPARVGGVWRGTMTSEEARMEVLVTIYHDPREGRSTWHATGTSSDSWTVGSHSTNLGEIVIKTHSFNPEGHYYELEGFGDARAFEAIEIH